MKYIANIITNSKIDVCEYINVAKNINDVDLQIPTLIIGWGNVKDLYPNANILEKKINDTVSWTYNNREKRQEYEPDLAKFIKTSFNRIDEKIPYTFFNVLTNKLDRIKKLLKYIHSDIIKVFYITEKHIYIYNGKSVTGISLSDLEFYGIKKEKVINYIKQNSHNKLVYSDSFINLKVKRHINENQKVIPYLYALKYNIF